MAEKMSVDQLYQKMSDMGMHGWIDKSEGEVIKKEVDKLVSGSVYLEVGVAFGKSLSTVCYYADEGVSIYGIDILNWNQRKENMEALGVGNRATFIEGDSQQEALNWDKPIDLLFIDGSHSYYGVIKDLLSWMPHVEPGGRIMMHDYCGNEPGVMRAIHDFIYPHPAYENFDFGGKPQTIYRFNKKGGV